MGDSVQETGAIILVVDDTPTNLQLLFRVLSPHGYQVRTISSGRRAIESALTSPPDLILLDIMMPEMNGYEVCRQLKADERTRDIPVLFISALDALHEKMEAFRVGGVDYLTRPFQMDEVLARVQTHLRLRSLQKQLTVHNARLEQVNEQLTEQIAERERVETALYQMTDRLQILREIDQAILGAQSLHTADEGHLLPAAVLGRMANLIPCRRISVVEFSIGGMARVLAVQTTHGFNVQITGWLDLLRQAVGVSTHILGAGDIGALPHRSPLQDLLLAKGIRAYLIVPLLAQGQLLGALTVESDQPNVWGPEHVNMAIDVAAMLAVAVQQVQLRTFLMQRTAELEAQNAELDAFAHTVAHDLRNPLTTLLGYSSLLYDRLAQWSPERITEVLGHVVQSARKMGSIIDELLLLSSVRGMENVQLMSLDMAVLIDEARRRIAYLIDEYQPEIVQPDSWPLAQGYGPWVEEVWVNYFSNAIKYGGRPPRIEFGAASVPGLENHEWVRFWVRDNGPGLSPEQQAQLFTPFEQLGQVRAKGHGLGLSIVKRIVERLGGQVGVESELGQGCCFYFTLPASESCETLR